MNAIIRNNSRAKYAPGLLAFLVACFAVSGYGGLISASSVGTWYPTLAKPPFNPPDWLFAPVWTALYLIMAIAGWRVWRRIGWRAGGTALLLFTAQLAFNLGWSGVFSGLRMSGPALAVIFLLLAIIAVTTRLFRAADRLAGFLFLPYLASVGFATMLNTAIWVLN